MVNTVETNGTVDLAEEPAGEIRVGLVDLIANAESEAEIKNLVVKGKIEYKNASLKTIKRWDKVAERRISQLGAPEPVSVESPKKEKKKKE